MAGLRRNALVAVMFVMLTALPAQRTIVFAPLNRLSRESGFPEQGVILRDGLNITGLNTAAKLWCSASIGAAGYRLYGSAVTGAIAVIGANAASGHLEKR